MDTEKRESETTDTVSEIKKTVEQHGGEARDTTDSPEDGGTNPQGEVDANPAR